MDGGGAADPTVMCASYTQTETRMDGGGGSAAVKGEYESELEVKNQKIWELEEELAVSKRGDRSNVDVEHNLQGENSNEDVKDVESKLECIE
jgi:hypothetical protein